MARRLKSADPPLLIPIGDWRHADDMLRRLGDLQVRLRQAECAAKADIDEVKSRLDKTAKPLQQAIELHVRSLEAFCWHHRAEFGKAKSRKLTFGVIGWRKSTAIEIIKKTTLDLIKEVLPAAKRRACIKVKESVDLKALAKLTDEELAGIQARRRTTEGFFVEPLIPEATDHGPRVA